jgi:superfamily II DNA or RNA helicase
MALLFRQNGHRHPYSLLRQQDEFGFVEYDLIAPPRRFFSGLDPLPPPVEIGVDSRRVSPIATPAEMLTSTLPSSDNWPAQSRRTVAKLCAWFLVCEDPQRRLESREVQTLAHQASLVRHVLDEPSLNRVLVADEVGLGKTVEAGLIIAELLERQPGLRILYLAPARLVSNVAKEFGRLGLRFRRWTSNDDTDANLQDERIIASIHKAAYQANAEKMMEAPSWDVLIVDECHHLSNYGADASKPVRQYSLVQKLIEKRPDGRVLLMSGTPHQGNPDRFTNLLRLLRAPGETEKSLAGRVIYRTKEDVRGWNDEPLFPLRQVNPPRIIPLTRAYEEWLEDIYGFYVPDASTTTDGSASARRRAAGWRCAQALQWAASSVQAGLGYLVRQAMRVGWGFEHDVLKTAVAAIRPYRLGPPDEPLNLLFGRLSKEVARQNQAQDVDDIEDTEDEDRWSADPAQLEALLAKGVKLLAQISDSKWDFIWNQVLSDAGTDQVVLFAQPIETVTALAGFLERKTGKMPALIIGGQSDDDREKEVRKFWTGETQFLISSRAGSEGINLQCAHRLVHVDIPWNPMEMEQRVGRVHRFGSKMTIIVDTVVLERTREERAYAVAYEKLRTIARSVTKDHERFEELFARVMSVIPPAELQDVMAQAAVGPLSASDCDRIASLVEAGYENWKSFHDRYHAEKKLRVPNPGLASWDDLERFIINYAKGKAIAGYSSLRFERRDKSHVDSVLDAIPVLELPDGAKVSCADVGGRPIIGPSDGICPAGLNVPHIATTLRAHAFPEEPTGVAHVRWPDGIIRPSCLPAGTVALLVIAQVAVRRDPGVGWSEQRSDLHLWVVPQRERPAELASADSAAVLRGVFAGGIRSRAEMPEDFAARIRATESQLIEDYRRRSESDMAEGIRYAVFPLAAVVLWN